MLNFVIILLGVAKKFDKINAFYIRAFKNF